MWRRPSGRVTKEFHFKEKKKISEHVFVFGCSREERKGEKLYTVCVFGKYDCSRIYYSAYVP